jgi:polyisoprenoid-binding protein YceI
MALRLPRTTRGILAMIAATFAAVVVGGSAFIYFVIFPTSAPAPFRLLAARDPVAVSSAASLAGTWKIAAGSQAGYRVREKLATLPAESDAVGRTSQITGSATFAQSGGALRVTAASFVTNVESLTSDSSMRDEHIRTIGIQSATYPTSTFKLTKPLTLPASALKGGVVHTTITGDVTMHGTTKLLTIPLELTLSSSKIRAVGSYTFPWGLFKMSPPDYAGFVTVASTATMEFDLQLTRG